MPAYTLAQLLSPDTAAVIRARIVANMITAGLPVSTWSPSAAGGTENIVLDQVSGHLAKYAGQLATRIAMTRFLDLATGDLLTYLARSFFFLDRIEAGKTIMTFRLTSTSAAPPFNIADRQLWFQGQTGNKYASLGAVTLSPGGTVFVRAEAEKEGSSYNDGDGLIDSRTNAGAFVTPLPGVDIVNLPDSGFTTMRLSGDSPGIVRASFTVPGVKPTNAAGPIRSVRVSAITAGNIGSGAWAYSFDDGVTFTGSGVFVSRVDLPGGVSLRFSNAPSTTTSFFAGDQWAASVATATVQQGTDQESDASLRRRCRFRWPSLSRIPTEGKVTLWAQRASAQVGRVSADADPSKAGQIDVVIAGPTGAVGSETAELVQDSIAPRLHGYLGTTIRETVTVTPALRREITAAGEVFVARKKLATVQAQALSNWRAYLGGLEIAGVVRLAECVQAVMDAGASGFEDASIGGTPNIQLARNEIATEPSTEASTLIDTLSWVPL